MKQRDWRRLTYKGRPIIAEVGMGWRIHLGETGHPSGLAGPFRHLVNSQSHRRGLAEDLRAAWNASPTFMSQLAVVGTAVASTGWTPEERRDVSRLARLIGEHHGTAVQARWCLGAATLANLGHRRHYADRLAEQLMHAELQPNRVDEACAAMLGRKAEPTLLADWVKDMCVASLDDMYRTLDYVGDARRAGDQRYVPSSWFSVCRDRADVFATCELFKRAGLYRYAVRIEELFEDLDEQGEKIAPKLRRWCAGWPHERHTNWYREYQESLIWELLRDTAVLGRTPWWGLVTADNVSREFEIQVALKAR